MNGYSLIMCREDADFTGAHPPSGASAGVSEFPCLSTELS